MYMNKKMVIIGGVVLVVLIALVAVLTLLQKEQPAPIEEPTTFPTGSTTTSGGEPGGTNPNARLVIKGVTGDSIITRDFLKLSTTVADPSNEGYYQLGNHFPLPGESATEDPNYVITYIAATQYFNVVLYKEPLARSRIEAEQYLMQTLGISRERMCFLSYTLSTPNSVNEYYTGRNLGFSFCPGSIPLE